MIIKSLLDTDLYKFSMMQAVLHQFPSAQAEYHFKCRTEGVDLKPLIPKIQEEVDYLCSLQFTEEELQYMGSFRFIKPDFIEFLGLFHMPRNRIHIQASDDDNGGIQIIAKGSWLHTILFEVPVLSIVNELYFSHNYPDLDKTEGRKRLHAKINQVKTATELPDFVFADYGSRRRFSAEWHDEVVKTLVEQLPKQFVGTSNVLLAKKHKTKPLGTMAHEFLQACQALGPRLRDSQVYALETWAKEYRGDLGIALSDVYGLNAFLRDFDMYFCKLFDGARHDSGDPYEWGERMIEHYKKNRVDPRTKTLVFSDSLTFDLALNIARRFVGRVKTSFGIGTNLTNDMGVKPLQIVMKMVRCNGQPVVKVSDEPNKTMSVDPEYLNYLRYVFDLPRNQELEAGDHLLKSNAPTQFEIKD
ncbi:nicotinate phosphoribosyltransferase [Taylorella asinigenitalis 14/45]|uniref:Nicotinate phosphoribosyltransferase n=1 Tax=Taylorella asinigenitalis 14/45 TaxID=1091495 RepID=I7IBT3_9BURK|nr:nicotinate phosphoribosyltransferase [Taylorella asinigenitalis]CCG19350.1 nicotinate phosphoribosyltransferase [Taylorella asinigenitalis 14/45]